MSEYKISLYRIINESKEERYIEFIYNDFINNYTKIISHDQYRIPHLIFLSPIDEHDSPSFWTYSEVTNHLRDFNPDPNYKDWYLDNEIFKFFKNRYGINDVKKIHDIWLGILDRIAIKMKKK